VFRRIRRSIGNLITAAKRLSILGAGLFGAAAASAIRFDQTLDNASQKLDVTAETLSGLKILANGLGISFEQLTGVMRVFQRRQGEAQNGNKLAIKAFEDLGISMDEVEGLNLEDLTFAIADGMKDASKSGAQLRADLKALGDSEALEIFALLARGGTKLAADINVLQDKGALRENRRVAENAEKARQIQEELAIIQSRLSDVLIDTLPPLTEALNGLLDRINELREAGVLRAPTVAELDAAGGTRRGVIPLDDPSVTQRLTDTPIFNVLKAIKDNTNDFGLYK
jgi:hypothetical protein